MLRTIARLDGTPFPATAALAGRWARGRVRRAAAGGDDVLRRGGRRDVRRDGAARRPAARRNYYDPGMFWSGDDLELLEGGARLGREIPVGA